MRDLSKTLTRLQAFRGRFEGLLAAAQKSAAGRRMSADQPSRLRELRGFGTNPGNLRMCAYAPEQAPSDEELVDSHRRRVWRDAKGKAQIEAFSINGMAHGVPLATTTEESCGSSGAFFLDVGISSTHRIARFWHLQESVVETRRAVTRTPAIIQANGRPVILSDVAAKNANAPSPPLHARWHERQFSDSSDPNAVIAAAFEAAGLPVPELHTASGSPQQVSPGPIIAAALKAAGLAQR